MREHWRELGFWRWWWHNRVPSAVKALAALVLLGAVVAGGWFAAQKLPSAKASHGSQTVVRTVERVVTVRAQGKVVVKRVPVIQKVYVANKASAVKTKTVRVASTVYGTRTVVQTVAAPRARAVTLPARTSTVTRTRTVTITKTVPTTTVQWKVITVVEKQKPVTVTVTVTSP